jgi:hypothetical protein
VREIGLQPFGSGPVRHAGEPPVLAEDLGLDQRGQVVRSVELLQQRRQVRDHLAGAQQVHAGQ